jgi:hypothetical protein
MSLDAIQRVIKQLKDDIGPDFIISLAPVYTAMLPRSSSFYGITTRKLNATLLPEPDPIMRAFCAARNVATRRNLSGFDYVELESSWAGKLISFYNVQFYNGWGDPCERGAYARMINAGWNSEKLVLGVLTNPGNGHAHRRVNELVPVIQELRRTLGDKFGGVMGWEYFNALHEEKHSEGPWEWVKAIGEALGRRGPATARSVEMPLRV